jgi:hypothetical protein
MMRLYHQLWYRYGLPCDTVVRLRGQLHSCVWSVRLIQLAPDQLKLPARAQYLCRASALYPRLCSLQQHRDRASLPSSNVVIDPGVSAGHSSGGSDPLAFGSLSISSDSAPPLLERAALADLPDSAESNASALTREAL